jgi:tetratricopeptide (TPR) repeat protein
MSSNDSTSSDASSTSVPSAANTSVGSAASDGSYTGTITSDPPIMEVVDRSSEENSEEMALKLKGLGNEQLVKGHFLEAIGFYSDALEYDPTNAIILSNRAQAYIKVENYGLAMLDATAAMDSDPKYVKAYYRRGSAQFALGHLKDARKDFRKVCQVKPKDKDARAKFQACDKSIKEDAFRKAIESEKTAPLSETFDPNAIKLVAANYDGPNPSPEGPIDDMDLEASMFEPGNLPRDFVLVRSYSRVEIGACARSGYPFFTSFLFHHYYYQLLGRHGAFQESKAHPQTLRGSSLGFLQKVF